MKIALLGDTHWGARNDSEHFLEHFQRFYDGVFFPYMKENGIQHVIQTGDFMDVRKNVNYKTLNSVTRRFMSALKDMGATFHVIPGNHDIYYRHTNEINSITELFSWMDHVTVYNHPTTVDFDKYKIDFIPWINRYNHKDTLDFMSKSSSLGCIGHFEINGFDMYAGIPGHGGLEANVFDSYDIVFSGHYHTRSCKGNILYVGTPYEITWSDFNDPRGFHVFDTETGEIEFIENPFKMFNKVFYNSEIDFKEFDFSELTGQFVKVIVQDRKKFEHYESFIKKVENAAPYDMSIVDSDVIVAHGVTEEQLENIDTFAVLSKAAEHQAVEADLSPKKMHDLIHEIYTEAVALGKEQ